MNKVLWLGVFPGMTEPMLAFVRKMVQDFALQALVPLRETEVDILSAEILFRGDKASGEIR